MAAKEAETTKKTPIDGLVKSMQGLLGATGRQQSFRLNASTEKLRREHPNGSINCSSSNLFLAEEDENEIAEFEASMTLDYTPESNNEDDDDDASVTVVSDTSDGDDATVKDL